MSFSLSLSLSIYIYIYIYIKIYVVLNNNLYITISHLKLLCYFHTPFEMWIAILNRRDYLEDIAINGKIKLHLKRIVLGIVGFIRLALSRDQRWNVLNTLMKPSVP